MKEEIPRRISKLSEHQHLFERTVITWPSCVRVGFLPVCRKQPAGRQGKDAPCRLLRWRQWQDQPTNGPEGKLVDAARLPPVFSVYAGYQS